MRVAVAIEGAARAGAAETFDAIVPIELARIFRGFGPLPAVTATRGQSGAWDHVGAQRVVVLSDGSEVPERITAIDRPRYFAYRVGPFEAGPLARLVVDARGEWWFDESRPGLTAVRWVYTFSPRPYATLAVRAVAGVWRRYAERVLAAAIAVAES